MKGVVPITAPGPRRSPRPVACIKMKTRKKPTAGAPDSDRASNRRFLMPDRNRALLHGLGSRAALRCAASYGFNSQPLPFDHRAYSRLFAPIRASSRLFAPKNSPANKRPSSLREPLRRDSALHFVIVPNGDMSVFDLAGLGYCRRNPIGRVADCTVQTGWQASCSFAASSNKPAREIELRHLRRCCRETMKTGPEFVEIWFRPITREL